MEATTTIVTLKDLEKLLFSIAESQNHVCIRYRTLGQLWYPNFLKLLRVQDGAALLRDDLRNQMINLLHISHIIQFELSERLGEYDAGCHYEVADNGLAFKN